MQFYWRVMEELKYLGETVIFHDPGLKRQYNWWLRKNSMGIALSETDDTSNVVPAFSHSGVYPSLN